jgi:hypothetical protein
MKGIANGRKDSMAGFWKTNGKGGELATDSLGTANQPEKEIR